MTKKEIYALLKAQCEKVDYRYTRYEMVSFCIGYFKVIDGIIWECIKQLHSDGFIDT